MLGEPIDSKLVNALEDGDVLVEGDTFYEFKKLDKTSEKNFEDDVEAILSAAGWTTFASNVVAQADYDRKLALKVDSLVGFVRETQPEEWAKIEGLYGSHTQERFLKRLCDELELHGERGGVVNVLRHGIRMAPGAQFRLLRHGRSAGHLWRRDDEGARRHTRRQHRHVREVQREPRCLHEHHEQRFASHRVPALQLE